MSKEKLTIEHLAPYLPYNLKYFVDFEDGDTAVYEMLGLFIDSGEVYLEGYDANVESKNCKPILRQFSDLTTEDYKEEIMQHYENIGISIKHISYYDSGNDNTEDITIAVTYKLMDDVFTDALINRGSVSESPYHFVKWLHENHFDTSGLIDQNLAININDLKDE